MRIASLAAAFARSPELAAAGQFVLDPGISRVRRGLTRRPVSSHRWGDWIVGTPIFECAPSTTTEQNPEPLVEERRFVLDIFSAYSYAPRRRRWSGPRGARHGRRVVRRTGTSVSITLGWVVVGATASMNQVRVPDGWLPIRGTRPSNPLERDGAVRGNSGESDRRGSTAGHADASRLRADSAEWITRKHAGTDRRARDRRPTQFAAAAGDDSTSTRTKKLWRVAPPRRSSTSISTRCSPASATVACQVTSPEKGSIHIEDGPWASE